MGRSCQPAAHDSYQRLSCFLFVQFVELIRVLYPYRTVFGESVHGVINMKDEDGFEPTSESTHLSLPTRYELANGFTSIPSRLLGDLRA